jgi:hypothetical protein
MVMPGRQFNEREDGAALTETPHLSFSRLNRYLHCPEQYRLYYVEGLRPRCVSANLVFGQVVHQALAALFRDEEDPVAVFERMWCEARDYDINYGHRDSWDRLRTVGQRLLEKFMQDEAGKISTVWACEKLFELRVTSLDMPLVGIIDLVAALDGKRTVVDFKTASSAFERHEAALSDQLKAYDLAEPEAEQAALCVFLKTKEPRIEWHIARRNGQQLMEFLAKAEYVAGQINSGRFYKRPGKWCGWCDYLPVCMKDEGRTRESLVRITQ